VDEIAAELHPVLAELLQRIADRIGPERREAVAAFAKAYTRRLSDEELAGADLEQLYAR